MLDVLRIGQEKLSDKGITSAAKRVGPLRQQTELPREVIIDTMVDAFRTRHGLKSGDPESGGDRGGGSTGPRPVRYARLGLFLAVMRS